MTYMAITTLKCECGKEIKGISQKSAEFNMLIHKKTSARHEEVMKVLKKGLK